MIRNPHTYEYEPVLDVARYMFEKSVLEDAKAAALIAIAEELAGIRSGLSDLTAQLREVGLAVDGVGKGGFLVYVENSDG